MDNTVKFFIILLFLVLAICVYAAPLIPQGNILLMGKYGIQNATNITATKFCYDIDCLTTTTSNGSCITMTTPTTVLKNGAC